MHVLNQFRTIYYAFCFCSTQHSGQTQHDHDTEEVRIRRSPVNRVVVHEETTNPRPTKVVVTEVTRTTKSPPVVYAEEIVERSPASRKVMHVYEADTESSEPRKRTKAQRAAQQP